MESISNFANLPMLKPYSGCPEGFYFMLEDESVSDDKKLWFEDAMKTDKMHYMFDGGLRCLRTKGKITRIVVCPIDDPLTEIPNITLYLSEHNNYHTGRSEKDKNDYILLRKLNLGDYKYFQDRRYFLAIRQIFTDSLADTFALYIAKKNKSEEPPRAQQD